MSKHLRKLKCGLCDNRLEDTDRLIMKDGGFVVICEDCQYSHVCQCNVCGFFYETDQINDIERRMLLLEDGQKLHNMEDNSDEAWVHVCPDCLLRVGYADGFVKEACTINNAGHLVFGIILTAFILAVLFFVLCVVQTGG